MSNEENMENLKEQNEDIARGYICLLADRLNETLCNISFVNKSKRPKNYFQLTGDLESGKTIWATFVYVSDKGKIIKSRSNIELLNEEYETIKKI